LETRIRAGDYLGSDLPSEAALAAAHQVSYLTARRAVARLVAAGMLERQPGGRLLLASRSETRPLMIGFAVPTWGSFDVLRWQRAVGEAAAIRTVALRPLLASGWDDPALLAMARRADGLIAYPGEWGPIPDALVGATRLVVVDRPSGRADVPALCPHPPEAVDALCAALAGWGRRRIAWIGAVGSSVVIAARRDRWLACAGGIELPEDPVAIATAVQARASDALLAATLPAALTALRAARTAGVRVPEDLAVAVVNDEGLGASLVPSLCAPQSPDLVAWLGEALAWIAERDRIWTPPPAPIAIDRQETA
jgi:hypothetical protein